jgi:hypothetical protein
MKENTQRLRDAMNDLTSARDELEDMRETFKGLTKGTKEWRKALVENNQKVLELINTYPELARYMTKGEFGELTIADDGWDAAL